MDAAEEGVTTDVAVGSRKAVTDDLVDATDEGAIDDVVCFSCGGDMDTAPAMPRRRAPLKVIPPPPHLPRVLGIAVDDGGGRRTGVASTESSASRKTSRQVPSGRCPKHGGNERHHNGQSPLGVFQLQ